MKNTKEVITQTLQQFQPSRDNVLKALHALQHLAERKYFTTEMLDAVATYFRLTRAEVYGIATYYSLFSVRERGKYVIRVCRSPVCRMMGSLDLLSFLEKEWNLKLHQTSSDGLFTLEFTECLGHCDCAPAIMVNDVIHGNLSREKLDGIIQEIIHREYGKE